MKLYVTPTSPYARLARMVIIEKGLSDRVEIIPAQTRTLGSSYYATNPSGRVPYLVTDGSLALEDSALICAYLDSLDGKPRLVRGLQDDGWRYGRAEMLARNFLDGIAVWAREMRRPAGERSPTILAHEAERARRSAALIDREVAAAPFTGPLNMAQLLLIAALDMARFHRLGDLETPNPRLAAWAGMLRERPSVRATAPDAANLASTKSR